MSSGSGPIANVEITNGTLSISEVWGGYAPDDTHSVELTVNVQVHAQSAENIHRAPVDRETTVFLTRDQLDDLTRQIAESQRDAEEAARREADRRSAAGPRLATYPF